MPAMDEDIEEEEEEARVESKVVEPSESERAPGFEEREASFREHFRQMGPTGGSYEQYSPAYRYGYSLRHRIADKSEWSAVEPSAKKEREAHNPNTLGDFNTRVRHVCEN